MKNYFLITLLLISVTLSFSVNSATVTMTFSFTTVPNNYIDDSFDFSKVPFTVNGNIKTYNIDEFTTKDSESKSSLIRSGITVGIYKHQSKGKTIIDVIF
jgi:hypothetical protein